MKLFTLVVQWKTSISLLIQLSILTVGRILIQFSQIVLIEQIDILGGHCNLCVILQEALPFELSFGNFEFLFITARVDNTLIHIFSSLGVLRGYY